MITSGDSDHLPDVDAHSSLDGLGTVELHHPTQDVTGDGILDTVTVNDAHGTHIWTSTHQDGIADHVTLIDKSGDYAAWEFHRHPDGTAEWVRTDQGHLNK
ncbi:DUF6802 family protein [Nocardia arthritidis]|uniref:DUF6802 domain-containing protein n=1 Tax=Nocardia arthritidis TaxID=228602 RepID=A0A6G9Y775_9NOCA|nr:DUF6802 family protein [Nocardia arthritidis]QIS09071.1 hypothetical protein F5544_05795 [Nocardia arthritidis]